MRDIHEETAGTKRCPAAELIKWTHGDKQCCYTHHKAHNSHSFILQWKPEQELSHTHLWPILNLQLKQKLEQRSSDICTGCGFISLLIREKESKRTKTSPVCNNSSVAWLKTHLCCATELYVLIGMPSDAELNSLCQSEPVEPNTSCFNAVVATFGHGYTVSYIWFTFN